mmetsp:Transcript_3810/g.13540  ORF Transcript_3810/g.13540 Transcript_3810/m.13540 type:complete len:201 (+) Transcript_3810:2187-2789(+)
MYFVKNSAKISTLFSSSTNELGPSLASFTFFSMHSSRSWSHISVTPSAPNVDEDPFNLCKVPRMTSKSISLSFALYRVFNSSNIDRASAVYISIISSINSGSSSLCNPRSSENCDSFKSFDFVSYACFSNIAISFCIISTVFFPPFGDETFPPASTSFPSSPPPLLLVLSTSPNPLGGSGVGSFDFDFLDGDFFGPIFLI